MSLRIHPLVRLTFCVVFSSLFLSPVLPQTPPQNTSPALQSESVLRSTTRLVQLNVVVQNKKGEPVQELSKERFTILDQGVPQQIAVFSAQSNKPRDPDSHEALLSSSFTNRFDQNGQAPGSVTVILFDALNTPIHDQYRARQQVVKFLRQLRPQDHVALYILTTKIITVNEFTQDASSLLKAVEKFNGFASRQLEGSDPKKVDDFATQGLSPNEQRMASQLRQFLEGGEGQISDYANIDRAVTTTSAMEAIANHVARIPGRKNLIWVSASFPFSIGYDADSLMQINREHRSFATELEHAARAMDQANMAVYPVDARGLLGSSLYDATNGKAFDPRRPLQPGAFGPNQNNFDTMVLLADRTGGRAFYNTNDIEGAIQRAIGDSEYTYTIGFYPVHGKWDGKFHELKVQVHEKGVTLRYRKGYFATPEPADADADNRENMDAAIRSPVDWTNLDLQVNVRAWNPATRGLTVQAAFDTRELQFVPRNGLQNGKIYLYFGQLGEGDKNLTSEQETFALNLKPETYNKLLQIGSKMTGQVILLPDVVNLRVVGQDANSGAIGTVTIPIKQFLTEYGKPRPRSRQRPTSLSIFLCAHSRRFKVCHDFGKRQFSLLAERQYGQTRHATAVSSQVHYIFHAGNPTFRNNFLRSNGQLALQFASLVVHLLPI